MPRRSSGGRSASRPSRPTMKKPTAPAKPAPAPAPAPTPVRTGGSVFGSIGGAISDGIGWGIGTSIGHRAVEAVVGPRVIQHEHVSSAPAAPASAQPNAASAGSDACNIHSKAFSECIDANVNEISKCQFYLDMFNECRRGSSGALQA